MKGAYKGVFYANDFSYLNDPCYDGPSFIGDNLKGLLNGNLDIGGEARVRYHKENNHRFSCDSPGRRVPSWHAAFFCGTDRRETGHRLWSLPKRFARHGEITEKENTEWEREIAENPSVGDRKRKTALESRGRI